MAEDQGLVGDEEHESVWRSGERGEAKDVTEAGEPPALAAGGPPGAGREGEVLEEGGGGCQALGVSSWKEKGTDSSSEK